MKFIINLLIFLYITNYTLSQETESYENVFGKYIYTNFEDIGADGCCGEKYYLFLNADSTFEMKIYHDQGDYHSSSWSEGIYKYEQDTLSLFSLLPSKLDSLVSFTNTNLPDSLFKISYPSKSFIFKNGKYSFSNYQFYTINEDLQKEKINWIHAVPDDDLLEDYPISQDITSLEVDTISFIFRKSNLSNYLLIVISNPYAKKLELEDNQVWVTRTITIPELTFNHISFRTIQSRVSDYNFIDVSRYQFVKTNKGFKTTFRYYNGAGTRIYKEFVPYLPPSPPETIEEKAEWLILPSLYYEYISGFENGYSIIRDMDKYGIIDTTGKEIVPPIYDWITEFSDGRALVQLGDKYGFVDYSGEVVIPIDYAFAWDFSNGRALVQKTLKDERRFIDINGNLVHSEYNIFREFSENRASVWSDEKSKWGFIDTTGTLVVDFKYDAVRVFYDGLSAVKLNDKWGFIDKNGNEVIPLIYDDYGYSFGDFISITKNGKVGLVGRNHEIIIPFIYDRLGYEKNGLIGVRNNDKFGYLDTTGKVIIPIKYDDIEYIGEGIISCQNYAKNKVVYYDNKGRKKRKLSKYNIWRFSDGLATIWKDGKVGFINKKTKLIIPYQFDGAYGFYKGFAAVQVNGKWGILRKPKDIN